jgi:hypothetical protein
VAVEVRAEPGHHWRGWCGDHGGCVGHGGGGGVAAPDLAEKEDGLGWRKMAEKDGLGRRRDGHGEDGLGAVAR